MKMTRKKWIIIAVVVALAAFLVWWFKKNKNLVATTSASAVSSDANDLEKCIKVGFGNDKYASNYAAMARYIYKQAKSTALKEQEFRAKADEKGYTFAQMAVIDAAYLGWQDHPDYAHRQYLDTVVARIKAMN